MEVLVTTDHTPSSNTSVTIWNPSTGTKLLALKGPCATTGSLVLLRDEGLLIAEVGKPFVHLWQVGSPLQSSRRIICPVGQQKLGPMTASPDGNYIVVAISEKINVWQVSERKISFTIDKVKDNPDFFVYSLPPAVSLRSSRPHITDPSPFFSSRTMELI